jgi:hypothetical protein
VNKEGLLLFDSVIQPSKQLKLVPLFDPSFGIPLKYLSEMLNGILNQRILVGHDIKPFTEMLKAD